MKFTDHILRNDICRRYLIDTYVVKFLGFSFYILVCMQARTFGEKGTSPFGWLRGTAVERRCRTSVCDRRTSLSYAWPAADEWPLMWV